MLVLILFYSLAGFLLLPWWLKRALPDQLEQQMGWQANVDSIRSNPFALSIEALNLSAQDSGNERVVGFDRLYLNLNFFDLLRGVVGFEAIELDEPFIRLDLLEDYSVNFARDVQAASTGQTDQTAEPEEAQTPPPLYLQRFTINGGELLFRDFTQPDMAEFQITPLDLTLTDLATWQREGRSSDYHLLAAIGDQTIEWQGNLSITPLYSSGNLAISGVDHKTLGHFLAPYLPYGLLGGKVTVGSDYELQAGDTLQLVTTNGRVLVEDLAVAPNKQAEQARLSTASIAIDDIGFDLRAREAQVGKISLAQPDVALARNNRGEIDWIATLAEFSKESEAGNEGKAPESGEPAPAETQQPFRWSLAGIDVSEGRVLWQDQQPGSPAELVIEPLSLSIGSVNSAMEDQVPYELQAALGSGGTLSVKGQLTPQPFTLEAAISGSGILLAVFEPYLQESANLAIAGGTLGLGGNLDLDGQQEPLTGTFSGTAEVSGLNLQLPGSNERLVSWQALRLSPVEYNVHPARLQIGTVTLAQPGINLVRNTTGVHNLEQVVLPPAADGANTATQESSDEEAQFILRIGQLMIEQGELDYTDRTLEPAFTTSLDQLNGSVIGLSNVAPQQGKVSLNGRIGGSASVEFDGTIGALGTDETSNLKLTMKDLSLPALSPYLGRYLGYGIDSGKLGLDLDYEITGSQINASNRVVMDRL